MRAIDAFTALTNPANRRSHGCDSRGLWSARSSRGSARPPCPRRVLPGPLRIPPLWAAPEAVAARGTSSVEYDFEGHASGARSSLWSR